MDFSKRKLMGRKLIRTPNGRWGFEEIPEDDEGYSSDADEFTSGESVLIKGRDEAWYAGRFESDHVKTGTGWRAEYYVIIDIGFTFYPRAGTLARRPTRWEREDRRRLLDAIAKAEGKP